MSSLIERIRKVSVVAAFMFECLAFNFYPNCLVWENVENLTFFLRCSHKRKKGWTLKVEELFLHYISFKTRKSVAKGQVKRSVLLQALKASPYIEIDTSLSTADEKFCRFTEKFKKLLNSILKDSSVTYPQELESPPNFTSFGSLLLQSTSEADNELENSMIPSTSGVAMPQTTDQYSAIAPETAPAVPDVDMTAHFDDPQSSFYPEGRSSGSVHSHNGLSSNGGAGLLQPEHSVHLPLTEQSLALYPSDYDPQEELLRSQRGPLVLPDNAGDVYVNSHIKAKSSAYEIFDVCSVELDGNRVRVLEDAEGPNTTPVLSRHYMVTIKGPTE